MACIPTTLDGWVYIDPIHGPLDGPLYTWAQYTPTKTPIKGRDAEFVGNRGGCHGRLPWTNCCRCNLDVVLDWVMGGSWVGFMMVVAETDGVARSKALNTKLMWTDYRY